jgi:hypothetical protein
MSENKKHDFWLKVIGLLATAAVSGISSYYKAREDSKQTADAGYKTLLTTVNNMQDAIIQLQKEASKQPQPTETPVSLGTIGTLGHGAGTGAGYGAGSLNGQAPADMYMAPRKVELTPPEKLFKKQSLPVDLNAAQQYQQQMIKE